MDKLIKLIIVSLLIALSVSAAEANAPTKANISYGPHVKNTLDLWLAKSDKPTPLLVYIHGGGWNANDKSQVMSRVKIDFWNKKGVSVASINYRLIKDAILPAPVHDAVRAIQFLKHKAADFNIKPDRIALSGVSAGACTALYILLHDDFADPQAHDPVLRQSSRVAGAIVQSGQTSIDPNLLKNWIGELAANYPMIWSSVGAKNAIDHQKNYQKYKVLSEEFSPINHLDKNDPPAYFIYNNDLSVPAKTPASAIHHGHFGIRFQEKADEVGYTCYLSIKGVTQPDPMVYPVSFLDKILLQYVSADQQQVIKLGPGVTECGPLEKFWRGQPVIGRWMGQNFLEKAPSFYKKSSFPYVRRKYSTEVEMADFFTTPRLLGGWHPDKAGKGELVQHKHVADADLVYRKKNGSLGYRWNLLDHRLTRFVKAGYKDVTLVLDQIPYCFVKKPHFEVYGQATPPDDMQEWYVFIRDLCKELRRKYGSRTANGFRFRLGTELGDGKRIAMTQEQLHEMYGLTHKAIKEVLPKAQLGPWNEAGFKDKQDTAPLSVVKLANYAKEQGLAFDFASVSSYSIPKLRDEKVNNGNPQQKVAGDAKFFQQLREIFPDLSVEYHEFGILNSQYEVVTNEPGARGGAYRANYLLTALENKAMDRLYHWSVFESIGKDKKHGEVKLLSSNGWLYSILEHAAGGELYVLEGNGEGNAICKSALITSRRKSYLIVSAYANDRRKQGTLNMTLSVPSEIIKNRTPRRGAIKAVSLKPQDEILQTVKKDLAKAGNLKPEFSKYPDLLAGVRSMAKNFGEARKMIMENYTGYQKQMVSSLTLKPFSSKMSEEGKNLRLTFSMPTDSVMVFVW